MKSKYLFFISAIIASVLYACSGGGSSSTQTGNAAAGSEGQNIFETNCAVCHGNDGTAGIANAANLNVSRLDSAAVKQVISNGKNAMPAFGSQLSDDELHKLVSYVLALRQ
jgi:mono/diheme cytochrome c family protein